MNPIEALNHWIENSKDLPCMHDLLVLSCDCMGASSRDVDKCQQYISDILGHKHPSSRLGNVIWIRSLFDFFTRHMTADIARQEAAEIAEGMMEKDQALAKQLKENFPINLEHWRELADSWKVLRLNHLSDSILRRFERQLTLETIADFE